VSWFEALGGIHSSRWDARYLLQNMDWLEEELGGYEDDYLIFDCPGTRKHPSLSCSHF
jgi:hypothetical protein